MHSHNFKDITGQRFGRLTAVAFSHVGEDSRAYWECKCDCGRYTIVSGKSLRSGNTSSCGCLSVDSATERIVDFNLKHGKSGSRLFGVWSSMKNRCNNPNSTSYKHYGGKGIHVCQEWENDFAAFSKWALENGYDETAKRGECTIDRIDNSIGYSPDNCRIANAKEQAQNRSRTRFITFNGERKNLADWARNFGKCDSLFEGRDDDDILRTFSAYERYKSEHGVYPRYIRM